MYRWKFLATEVDDLNFSYAVKNIKKNNMTDFIHGT
jgi:23S rRNA A1618 N6-methylase RlmF